MHKPFSGVLPTATGSEVHRLSQLDGTPINNGNMNELLSEQGIQYIQRVIENSIRNGANIGVTSTFRVTPFRAENTGWEFSDRQKFELPDKFAEWNSDLVHTSRKAYGDRLLLGNISPITDTSAGEDDMQYAKVGGGSEEARIEFSRQRHHPQISLLSHEGVDGILVEAGRHPDDMLGIARSVREQGLQLLVVSFEADEHGVPDVIQNRDGFSFADMRSELQREAGDNVDVRVGINCIGATLAESLLAKKQVLDVVYPNQTDPGRFAPLSASEIKHIRMLLNEASEQAVWEYLERILSIEEDWFGSSAAMELRKVFRSRTPRFIADLIATLDRHGESTPTELQNVWNLALETGTQVIGICCGGRPTHVSAAREVYDGHSRLV